MLNEKKPLPTPEELRALLRYEPETGKLFWLPRPREMFSGEGRAKSWNILFANAEAFTSRHSNGYRFGAIHHRLHRAHRVIWAMVHGEWPSEQIDHVNGSRSDNRIENLRVVSRTVNMRNRKMSSNNTSGVNGVHWNKQRRKWMAYITINGERDHLGFFDDIEDAATARKAADRGHGFTERHGLLVEEATP